MARSGSSTAPTTRRCSSSGCTPSSSSRAAPAEAKQPEHLAAAVPRDQRVGALPGDNGIRMVKLFLNLSKEEQRRRFLKRIDRPDKNWKFSAADVRERGVLGRLPARVLGDALAHEHRVGAVARHPRRPEVVRADRAGRGDRERADRDRPRATRSSTTTTRRQLEQAKAELEAEAPRTLPTALSVRVDAAVRPRA